MGFYQHTWWLQLFQWICASSPRAWLPCLQWCYTGWDVSTRQATKLNAPLPGGEQEQINVPPNL